MSTRILMAVDSTLPKDVQASCRAGLADLANYLGDIVLMATMDPETLDDLRAWTYMKTSGDGLEGVEPVCEVAPAAPMSAAPFVYKDDGRPDWGAMWGTFCELALYGGPPHRGIEDALEAPQTDSDTMIMNETIMELRRGIHETTGLFSEPAPPNWLAVTCHSKKMAAWMAASIILENVDAKCEDEILYVPCSPDFDLKNQVKSVITVVAKVNHYWQAHIESTQAAPTA
jgi:hypothetical protein